ncbi:MAG TPA: hypothetical protein EYG49_07840 [Gammaproteobacteria bacterium]|nr:hypothetical protein [Gammaproteobacteria bacterium]
MCRFVDWEIKATLDKKHGLIGVQLPTIEKGLNNTVYAPDRLNSNINSGYALCVDWNNLTLDNLISYIETANSKQQTAKVKD